MSITPDNKPQIKAGSSAEEQALAEWKAKLQQQKTGLPAPFHIEVLSNTAEGVQRKPVK